jgi:protein O-GlcNAc transferase
LTKSDQFLHKAMEHHRGGRLSEAERLYREVLALEPAQTDALYLLGLLAHQKGEPARAVGLIEQSLAIAPEQPQCRNVLGLALMQMGRLEESAAAFGAAIALDPAPEFYNNLGNLRREQGRFDDAIVAYGRAVELQADFADAHYNLGNALRGAGRLEEAAEAFRRAIALEPNHAHALAALGQVLAGAHRPAEALPYLQRAVALVRDDAELYCDVGDVLQKLGRRREAVARYQKAIRANARLARPWFAAGCAEKDDGDYASAALCFGKAVGIAPEWAAAHHNLADALFNLGRVDEALGQFRRAESGGAGELPRAMIAVIIPGAAGADHRAILEARRNWAEQDLPRERPAARFEGRKTARDGRLRVGYVSSFFPRDNWMKPVWGLINRHDRGRFAVHLFSDGPEAQIRHGYRRRADDCFHDISGLSNEQAADAMERAGIDLLLDLNGYSRIARLGLVALRPAPRAAAWFNMYGTSGMAAFDYLVGDGEVIRPEDEAFYQERIVRVPGSCLTFEVAYPVPPVAAPPCVTSQAITFGCLCSQYKITAEVARAWSRILQQAPGSRLLLRNATLGSAGVRQWVEGMLGSHGIAADRVQLLGPAEHFQFLETYSQIDVALDTFPYNGGTTTTEAIWQGVPVVSWRGDRWAARTSASILRAGGLGEFVAESVEGYVALAVRLATSAGAAEKLAELRRTMRAHLAASAVCDTAGFARNMESLYERMIGS